MTTRLTNFISKTPYLRLRLPKWVSAALFISCVFFSSFLAHAECNVKGDGRLSLYSYHIDEYLDVTYRSGEKYNQAALEKIYKILRSPDGEIRNIDIDLIDIIDHLQDHFGARTVEIISGYRSPSYNAKLKKEGRNVAKESLHMEGKAADIHIDEVTDERLKEYALSLNCGGVGLYIDNDFVHLDVGPAKKWVSTSSGRKLVGMNNNKSPFKLITDKNDYFKNETIKITLITGTFNPFEKDKCFFIETFRNGKWIRKGEIELTFLKDNVAELKIHPKECRTNKVLSLPFGRYRLRHKNFNTFSNEFYYKKY